MWSELHYANIQGDYMTTGACKGKLCMPMCTYSGHKCEKEVIQVEHNFAHARVPLLGQPYAEELAC